MTPLHQWFGLMWVDFFAGTDFEVEREKDLSLKQQLLDLIIIRRRQAILDRPLPDGFDPLADSNLVTFKSHQETLDGWALLEFVGHFVNYRKQISPSMNELLPLDRFRLYAVCVRRPQTLIDQGHLQSAGPSGVYDTAAWGQAVRVIVVNELAQTQPNVIIQLFSNQLERLSFAATHFRPRSSENSTLLVRLLAQRIGDDLMPETLQEFARRTIRELLDELPPEERLAGLPPEVLLLRIPMEKRIEGLPPDQLLALLSPEQLDALRRQLAQQPPQCPDP